MKKVLIRGPLLTQSGYGVHSRQILSYFLSRKDVEVTTQILQWGITPWCVNSEKEGGIYAEAISRNKKIESKFDLTIQIQLPNEWDPSLGNYNVGVTAGVETDRCLTSWATEHREKMNLVIVPSSHTKMSFLSSSTGKEKTPIQVVPESYFSELEIEDPEQIFNFKTQKNFLTIGMLTADDPDSDRKNLFNTVKWFCQEYDGNSNVGLIVKTSKGRETTIDRELVRKTLKQVVQASGCKKPPAVYMLHGSMTRKEMNSLYRHPSLLGFVSATRGEGFGLPMLESAVSGLPVICTNWSSVPEFLTGKSFIGVEYDLVSIPGHKCDNVIFAKGSRWANPRESNFKKKLRKLEENFKEYKAEALSLSESLKKSHSQKEIDRKYGLIFDKILETV